MYLKYHLQLYRLLRRKERISVCIMTRSIGTTRISNFSPKYTKEVISEGFSQLPLEIDVLRKKKTCHTNNDTNYFSKKELITERSSNTTKFQLGKKELLAEHKNVFWIFRRWAQCPAADRPAPVPGPCSKTPTVLTSSRRGLDPDIPQPKVIIIGAGMAGLSAAYGLAQAGFKNFQIVEATDRLGGRIHSCWLGDVVGELGPAWINNATVANPLYSMAAQENLLKPPLPWRRKPPLSKAAFLSSDGRAIETHITVPAVQLFKKIKSQALSLFSMDVGKGHGSLLAFIKHRMADEMKAVPADWQADVSRVITGLLNEYKGRFGVRPCQISSDMYGSSVSMPGGALRIPLGIHGILAPLLKKIDPKCISYCKPVQGINWHGGRPRATIRFVGGDVLTADYIIVTVPLGVLKCNSEALFTPCLPESKVNSIRRVGFGTINRILLRYSKPFWLPGEGFIHFAWSEKELKKKDSWTKGISLMENVPGTFNMMSITLGDQEAVMTENCSDESIAVEITRMLRSFSGDFSLPYPAGIVRSKWFSQEHFRGSNSCLTVGSTIQDICELSSPLPEPSTHKVPILLFAGEATISGYSGTLLGAHMSGLREAQRVLTLTKKYHGSPPFEELQ